MQSVSHSSHNANSRPFASGHGNHNSMPVNGTMSAWQPAELQRATIDANRERYADIDTAINAGYRFHKKSQQNLADPSKTMFHLKLITAKSDGSVLDPNTPEHVIYRREPGGKFTLVGVMYETGRNDGSPVVGDLGRFHRHVGGKLIASEPGKGGMMHVWFSSRLNEAYSPHAPAEIKRGAPPTMSPEAAGLGGARVAAPRDQTMSLPALMQHTNPTSAGAGLVDQPFHSPQYSTAASLPRTGVTDSLLGWLQRIVSPLFVG